MNPVSVYLSVLENWLAWFALNYRDSSVIPLHTCSLDSNGTLYSRPRQAKEKVQARQAKNLFKAFTKLPVLPALRKCFPEINGIGNSAQFLIPLQ